MKHILIIRFSAMGDVAMLVPVVASLARQYPDIHVTVLSRPFAHSFFELCHTLARAFAYHLQRGEGRVDHLP